MLAALNAISTERNDRVLCFESKTGNHVTLTKLQQDLGKMKAKVVDVKAESWLLFSTDSYRFLLGLMTLLGLKKRVIICASIKPEWVDRFSDKFTAVLSDEPIAGIEDVIDFSLSQTSYKPWQPLYTGSEEMIFFTSGSSGLPKSINKSLLALLNEISTLSVTFGNKLEGTVFLASVSHLHIYGLLFKLLLPLLTKGSWFNQQIEYQEQLPPLINAVNKAVFISSPAFLSRLDLNLPATYVEGVFSSGGPLSLIAANTSAKYFGSLPIEVYGSTETGGIAFRQQLSTKTPWTPFEGIRLEVVTSGTRIYSPHVPDEPGLLLDDNLEINSDGSFKLEGRKDRVIKIEEKRVSLTEIERYIQEFENVEKCIALVITGSRDVIGCVVVLNDAGKRAQENCGSQSLVQNWKNRMKERFELVTIPKKWRVVEEIPLNSQSKVDIESLLTYFQKK